MTRNRQLCMYILDMHSLAAASCSILLDTKPTLFVFETSYYAFCHDVASNMSLRKRKREYS